MAYQKKIAFNFTLIDQILYEIITNQFIPLQVAAHLTPFDISNLSLQVIKDAQIIWNPFCFSFLLILKICLLKELSVLDREKE